MFKPDDPSITSYMAERAILFFSVGGSDAPIDMG